MEDIQFDVITIQAAAKATYPNDHVAGMRVPKGGSNCAKCEYLADNKTDCTNKYFQKWNGGPEIPGKIDEYCSDWFESSKKIQAGGPGSGRHKEFNKLYRLHDEIQDGEWTDRITDDDTKHSYIYSMQKGMLEKLQQGLSDFIGKGLSRDPDDAYASAKKPHPLLDSLIKDGQKSQNSANSYADKRNYRYATIEQDNALNYLHNALERVKDILESGKNVKAATEVALAGNQKGSIWNGIKITGFTGPEEEGLRALLSRVPPELLFNVKEIVSSPELHAKHGQFMPETSTVKFNPHDFQLRQRLGKGPSWMLHQELTAVHEIGHSIYETLTPEKVKEWEAISGWIKGTKQGQAPPYEEKRPGWPHTISKWTHRAGVYMPRLYSEKNPNEQFSDCFAFVLLGKAHQMEPGCKNFIDALIKAKVKKYPSVSIQSPSTPYPEKTAIRKSKTV